MIRFHCLTIFPELFTAFTSESICARAIAAGLVEVKTSYSRTDPQIHRAPAHWNNLPPDLPAKRLLFLYIHLTLAQQTL